MSKNILDEILKQDVSSAVFNENEVLSPLLEEIDLIRDENIASFVRSVLLKADSFWSIPSSFSGKYHPPDEHGEGGNVLHTKRVVRVAKVMAESYALSEEETDILFAACILHDVTKGVLHEDCDSFSYDPMHPYTVGKFVVNCQISDKEHANDGQSTSLFVPEDAMQTILRLIRCHLGPWSPVPETYPISYMDYIVHLSDNIASKLHIIIEDSDLINDKWRKSTEED